MLSWGLGLLRSGLKLFQKFNVIQDFRNENKVVNGKQQETPLLRSLSAI
jgi:hypothetical protein